MEKIGRKKNKIYEAVGFVEAMMAIMIIGTSSIVLLQIAVNTMKVVLQNEAIDDLTQYAIEGGEMIQEVANKERARSPQVPGEELFPPGDEYLQSDSNCFLFKKEEAEGIILLKDEEEEFVKFNSNDRDSYKDEAILSEDDEYFRIVCLDNPRGGTGGKYAFVYAEIIVGQRRSSGTITKGNAVKDYTYRTIVKL